MRPCALKPPSIVADCGVSPMWPITGMPAPTIARARDSIGPAPSSFTASAPRLLHEAHRVLDGVLVGHLVRAERHVGDDERPPRTARHRAREHEHLVHRGRHGRVVAEHGHRRRVAHEDDVDAGLVGQPAARGVVGGDHHDRVAARLHLGQLGQRQLAGAGVAGAGLRGLVLMVLLLVENDVVDEPGGADADGGGEDGRIERARST